MKWTYMCKENTNISDVFAKLAPTEIAKFSESEIRESFEINKNNHRKRSQ